MRAVARTEVGLVRKSNEDSFLCDEKRGLFIVADGMGGHLAGEVASQMAIEVIISYLKEDNSDPLLKLKEAVAYANQVVYTNSQENHTHKGMGTTVTLAYIVDDKANIAHVGDSRAYIIRNKAITLLTCDHSYVGELVRSGEITQEQAMAHPKRNMLMRAIGTSPEIDIDLLEINLKKNDILLLCTDGLSNHLRDEEMLQSVLKGENLQEATDNMMEIAYKKGANDNITVLLTQYR